MWHCQLRPQEGRVSLVPSDSPPRESHHRAAALTLLSTLKAFETARDFLSVLVPLSHTIWEMSAAASELRDTMALRPVLAKGKLAVIVQHRSPHSQHCSLQLPRSPRSDSLASESEAESCAGADIAPINGPCGGHEPGHATSGHFGAPGNSNLSRDPNLEDYSLRYERH